MTFRHRVPVYRLCSARKTGGRCPANPAVGSRRGASGPPPVRYFRSCFGRAVLAGPDVPEVKTDALFPRNRYPGDPERPPVDFRNNVTSPCRTHCGLSDDMLPVLASGVYVREREWGSFRVKTPLRIKKKNNTWKHINVYNLETR